MMKKNLLLSLFMTLGTPLLPAQTLSNGITLPDEWPPRYPLPTERKEMVVPYLEQKPEVMPINVGRQLFVDSFLISSTTLKSVYHTPNFYAHNPVLKPTEKWEETTEGAPYAAPFSDGLWYDDKEGIYKMWYLAGAGMLHKQSNQTFYTCYAESKDGKTWTKPALDIVPGTNIVDTCRRDAASIWLDRNETDPAKRWKMCCVQAFPRENGQKSWQLVLKYSADGRRWNLPVAQSGEIGARTTVFYNPFTRKWALSIRGASPIAPRSRFYVEHDDIEQLVSLPHRVNWNYGEKNIRFWFGPDDKEQRHEKYPETDPAIYNFDVIPYESIMLGLYAAWSGPDDSVCKQLGIQKRNVIELGYSRDGFHFARPVHTPFMNVNETEGAWNWGNMQSVVGVPLIVGDSLYFYSSGRQRNDIMWDSHTSTGLATLRRDGFVSMQATKQEGYLTTEKVTFDGRYLFVNADVHAKGGKLLVEILDENGQPMEGYTKADCIAMQRADKTLQRITWKGHSDVSPLAGKSVRFKFYLTQGDLYAFWVSPWETGESRGYTAGGGPGLSPSGVDRK